MIKLYRLYIIGLCGLMAAGQVNGQSPVDSRATAETRALNANLNRLLATGVMFGHHEGDAYGTSWKAVEGRSDVKDVCGAYPAVHGWDVGKIGGEYNIDGVKFADMHRWIKDIYNRGGINTISWHGDNPVTRRDAWDKTPAVKDILPGGKAHAYYVQQLALVADFLEACKTDNGTKIPIIFRPYHEHNGDWFWWGKGNCTEAEYIQLWHFTVDYLRTTRKLNHLLYAFSPDRSRMDLADGHKSYQYAYPGDDYVDIIGLDDYQDVGVKHNTKTPGEQRADLIKSLQVISELAKEKGKVAAVTETGLEGITNSRWFTQVILDPLKTHPEIKISYIMVWRNGNTSHFYAPYAGHASEEDFKRFYADETTLFEGDLGNIYK